MLTVLFKSIVLHCQVVMRWCCLLARHAALCYGALCWDQGSDIQGAAHSTGRWLFGFVMGFAGVQCLATFVGIKQP